MQAAEQLFGSSGYAAVSVADIAQRCEMSKKTIYEQFASKEELFKALVADAEAFPLSTDLDDPNDPAKTLISTLVALARFVLSERHITVSRLVIAESGQIPEMAQHYYDQGMLRGKKMVVTQLKRLTKQGLLRVDDIDATADMLFGASIGFFLLISVSLRTKPNMKEVETRIRMAVERFL